MRADGRVAGGVRGSGSGVDLRWWARRAVVVMLSWPAGLCLLRDKRRLRYGCARSGSYTTAHQQAGASMPQLLLLAVTKVNWTAARLGESRKEGMGKVVQMSPVWPRTRTVEEKSCLGPVGWAEC